MNRAFFSFSLLVALASGGPLRAPEARADDLCRDAYLGCVSSANQCRAEFDAQASQCRRQARAKWNECEQWHRTNRPGVAPREACLEIANEHEQCGAGRETACPTANACLVAVEECHRAPRAARATKPTVEPAPTQGRSPLATLRSQSDASLSPAQRTASWSPSR